METILSVALVLGFCGLAGAQGEKAEPVGTWKCEYKIGDIKRMSTLPSGNTVRHNQLRKLVMSIAPLAIRASLKQYARQAADLINAYRSGDPAALHCLRQLHPCLRGRAGTNDRNDVTDADIRRAGVALADAQCVVARWYGFEDWQTLAGFVEAVSQEGSAVWQFESAVEAIITGDLPTLKRLLDDNRELVRARSTRALVDSFSKTWEPDDGWLAWERLAYRLIDCFVSTPLEQIVPFAHTPVTLDASAQDWLLAIGCADGATFVQQLRLPIHVDGEDLSARDSNSGPRYLSYHPEGLRMGLSGARAALSAASTVSRQSRSKVRFLPGGVLSMPLEVTWPPNGGGASFSISHVDFKIHRDSRVVDKGTFAIAPSPYDPSRASLSLGGQLTLWRREGPLVKCQLKPRTDDDEFVGIVFLEKDLSYREPLTVACISRRGRYYHLNANGDSVLQWQGAGFLDLTIQAEVDIVSAHGSTLLVSTCSEAILISYDQLHRILAYKGGRITTAALLDKDACCIGYEDGAVETFRISPLSPHSLHSRRYRAHNGSVRQLKPCWTQDFWSPAVAFLSVGADGVAQVWPGSGGGPSHVVLPQVADIRTACFAEHGEKLITGHNSGELRLWDISKPAGQRLVEDVLEIGPPELAKDVRSFLVEDGAFYVSAGHMYGGPGWSWQVTRSDHRPITGDNVPASDKWVHGRACWAADRSSILVFQPDPECRERLLGDVVLVRLDPDGRASWSHPNLPPGTPSTFACSQLKPEFVIFYADGSFLLLDGGTSEILWKGDLSVQEFEDKTRFAASWCSFTPDGQYVVALIGIRPRLVLISTLDGRKYFFDQGTEGQWDFILGPVVVSPCGTRIYAACGDGSVIAVNITSTPPEVYRRHEVPGQRYTGPYGSGIAMLEISSDGQLIAAGSGHAFYVWATGPHNDGRRHERDEEIKQLRFASNDRLVIVDESGRCSIVSAITGEELYSPPAEALPDEPLVWVAKRSLMAVRLSASPMEERLLMCLSVYSSPYELFDHLRALRRRADVGGAGRPI
jgi:WD40 repeat protein